MASGRKQSSSGHVAPEAVSFGTIASGTVVVIDEMPKINTGVAPKQIGECLADDATVAAVMLTEWGASAGLIGTKIARDEAGRRIVRRLKELGVRGSFRMTSKFKSPFSLTMADKAGNRTYFWERPREILETLDEADLSMIRTAKLLYLDWYNHPHTLRAIKEAEAFGVPVFFNFEHAHEDAHLLSVYGRYVHTVQACTDIAQVKDNASEVGERLLNAGASLVLVTMASRGCLAMSKDEAIRIHAPSLGVVDSTGAGATFSAGFIFGTLQGWELEKCVRFAVAAASLKCTTVGLAAFPVSQIRELADQLRRE